MSKKKSINKAKTNFIKVKKTDGQYILQLLKEHFKNESVIDHKYKISYENKYIFFPLVKNKEFIDKLEKTLDNSISYEILSRDAIYRLNYKYRTLQEALFGKIPDLYSDLIPKSYDIVGNIAIVEFTRPSLIDKSDFSKYKNFIAKAIIAVNKNVQSVFEKKGEIKGVHRLRKYAYLSGENTSETIHRENNCCFKLDIKTTFFSPRLVNERRRIANINFQEEEVIVDMFAGVGPFSIQIAKKNSVNIHAFDINPYAYNYLCSNIELNKSKGRINPHNRNIKDLLDPSNHLGKQLYGKTQRVIMNLPEHSIDFIDVACFLLKKSGGFLNYYQISEKPNPIGKSIEALKKALNDLNWVIAKISLSKIVKSYSPRAELVVIDLIIKHNSGNS
ncbi:MAG: class I SAM-dependent methyltransferase [Candidatus Hodarchaeales archaeon]|jgi:tRNA (guanine37-N1)-methyltransferase